MTEKTVITIAPRENWKRPAEVEVPFQLAISNRKLERAVVREFALLDNHLYFLAVLLARMPFRGHPDQSARVVALQDKMTRALDQLESAVKRLTGDAVIAPEASPSRVVAGVKKTPQATRVLGIVALMDAALRAQETAWIEGEIDDAQHAAAAETMARLLRNLCVTIGDLFRKEALPLASQLKAERADLIAALADPVAKDAVAFG